MFIGSLEMIVLNFGTFIQPLLGLIPLGLALALRPRIGRLIPGLPVLREADAPALFALLHRTADSAGARHVDTVQLTAEFDVRVAPYGVRRRRCLFLGLPLWSAFSPQQRIAAVTQAFGESGPRDLRSSVFVGSALKSVAAGAHTMRSGDTAAIMPGVEVHYPYVGEVAAAARRFDARSRRSEWVLWIPRVAASATSRLLLRCTRPAARRAQFEADDAAARTASSPAALAALRDRDLARATYLEMHRLAVEKKTLVKAAGSEKPRDDLWESIGRHTTVLREQRETSSPLGSTPRAGLPDPASHDAIAQRITRLAEAPQHAATITLDASDRALIEDELHGPKQAVERLVLRDGIPLPP
ncbi:M48 family metallopeptidase [Streptomyces californicus]|uniref:M48 family metallopeptidase n=1 Tax=Streptomyces californicus TaxID=67351 RepID=UPI00367E9F69